MEVSQKTRIIAQNEIAPSVYYIKLERQGDFIPGQLLALSDSPDGRVRYYSIASGVDDDYWGILYNKVEDGWLTPRLSGLTERDSLYRSPPFGEFTPRKDPMVWIATGTGIAPFRSMLRSAPAQNKTLLIQGARQRDDFYFFDEFKAGMKERYIPCSSLLHEPGFYEGRLSLYLDREFDFPMAFYYLCGSSTMVVDIRDLLLSKGVEFDRIVSEIYF